MKKAKKFEIQLERNLRQVHRCLEGILSSLKYRASEFFKVQSATWNNS